MAIRGRPAAASPPWCSGQWTTDFWRIGVKVSEATTEEWSTSLREHYPGTRPFGIANFRVEDVLFIKGFAEVIIMADVSNTRTGGLSRPSL
jgi:hypothetical protein